MWLSHLKQKDDDVKDYHGIEFNEEQFLYKGLTVLAVFHIFNRFMNIVLYQISMI